MDNDDDYTYLQPLRIPVGWSVSYNTLPKFDPSPETVDYFYGEWLFAAVNDKEGLGVEITFSPKGDPDGSYSVDYYRIQPRAVKDTFSQQELELFTTNSRETMVKVVEHLMWNGSLPQTGQ